MSLTDLYLLNYYPLALITRDWSQTNKGSPYTLKPSEITQTKTHQPAHPASTLSFPCENLS